MMSLRDDENDHHNDSAKAVEEVDKAIGHSIAAYRNETVPNLLGRIGEIGDQGPLYACGATVMGIGLVRKNPRWIVAGISTLAAVGIADLLKSAIKNRVTRTRPDHSLNEGEYQFDNSEPAKKEERSFPSGHVACTVAASNALGRLFPTAAPYLWTGSVFLSATRLLKGKHWPLDLIAGAMIGLVAERTVRAATPRKLRELLER